MPGPNRRRYSDEGRDGRQRHHTLLKDGEQIGYATKKGPPASQWEARSPTGGLITTHRALTSRKAAFVTHSRASCYGIWISTTRPSFSGTTRRNRNGLDQALAAVGTVRFSPSPSSTVRIMGYRPGPQPDPKGVSPEVWVKAELADGLGRLSAVVKLIAEFVTVVIMACWAAAGLADFVESRATWVKWLGRVGAVLLVAIPAIGGGVWLIYVLPRDGVYSDVRCAHANVVEKVEIGPDGFLAKGCVETYDKITFVNRTEETSFVLCVGRNGDCFRDEQVPRELRGRLVVEPGTARQWEFPLRRVLLLTDISRNYPLTLSGVAGVAAPDLVVERSYVPPSDSLLTIWARCYAKPLRSTRSDGGSASDITPERSLTPLTVRFLPGSTPVSWAAM
jgi:hypothetical protein